MKYCNICKMEFLKPFKTSTNSRVGSHHWFMTHLGRVIRHGECLMMKNEAGSDMYKMGKSQYDTGRELAEGVKHINGW